MKRHITGLFLLLFASLSLAACNNNKTNSTPDPAKLATPANLQISGTILTWTAAANASGYSVEISGTSYNAASARYDLFHLMPGTWQIRVMAKGDGTNFTDSDWSAPVTYTFTPTVLHELPGNLEVSVDVLNETGAALGVITRAVLESLNQVDVLDGQQRIHVGYSLNEVLMRLGISTVFSSAEIVADDDFRRTVPNFDGAHFTLGRIGSDWTTRVFVSAGSVNNPVTITLTGGVIAPPPASDSPYDIPGSLEVNIELFCDQGNNQGIITKDVLANVEQVVVPDPTSDTRHYVAYPLPKILEQLGVTINFTSVNGEAADGFYVIGTIDDASIAVVRRHANGDVESSSNFPRLVIPSGQGFRAGDSTVRPGVVSNVIKITLER